ncbi:hypothetical protein EG329_006258 [Mollisiaceae sp. DMI_Dod_QoI]|nr:hypothetical protein EG329_006258 [Helotiales sp. DMI_Dod_QoI]
MMTDRPSSGIVSTDADTFYGWVAHSPSAAEGKMQWGPYRTKPFTEFDIEIEVFHCGICVTDVSTLRSGWAADLTNFPIVVGHEIIGRAIRVGSLASRIRGFKVGDRVGTGHFGVMFAKALGAEIVAVISRSTARKADAQKMGADVFIATGEEPDWQNQHEKSLDLIVFTVNGPNMPLVGYLKLLRQHGQLIQIGATEDLLPQFDAHALIMKGVKIGGSLIGSPNEIEEMLQFAVEKIVRPWIEKGSMKDANQAVIDMGNGRARYKYTSVDEGNME